MAGCPLCDGDHAVCRFAAGSLYCVESGCRNPHHRNAPAGIPDRLNGTDWTKKRTQKGEPRAYPDANA